MEKLFETITNEIGLKVEKHIQIKKLFTPKEDVDYKEQLEDALKLIQQGRRILISWKENYQAVSIDFLNFNILTSNEIDKKINRK